MNAHVLRRAALALGLLAVLLVVALVGRFSGIGAEAAAPVRDFTITAQPTGRPVLLSPGIASGPFNLAVTNPGNRPLRITELRIEVTGTSRSGCAAKNFSVKQYAGPYPLTVAAHARGVRLTSLGAPTGALPSVAMLDGARNQDACKGVTVNLAYTGSATNR